MHNHEKTNEKAGKERGGGRGGGWGVTHAMKLYMLAYLGLLEAYMISRLQRHPMTPKPSPTQHSRIRKTLAPCRAVPYRAVPCHAVPCLYLPCRAMPEFHIPMNP